MNRGTCAWLAVALLSISALGVSATTLESTMTTDANDVVDLNYDQVPIGENTASNVLDEIEGSERDGAAAGRPNSDAQQPAETYRERANADSEAPVGGNPAQGEPQRQQQREQRQGSTSTTPELPSLLDRLLDLLPFLLAVVAVVGAIGLAVRYRERLAALFADPDSDDAEATADDDATDGIEGSPAHTVESAWLEMVRRLDLDRPDTMTTSECARAAVDAGLDREAVRRLTETYEEVRYGGRPVTDQREEAARRSQRRLDTGGGA